MEQTISKDKIVESLIEIFSFNYYSMLSDFRESLQSPIDEEENKELIIISMISIIEGINGSFRDVQPVKEYIIKNFQDSIFNIFFKNPNERKDFEKIFRIRYDEYTKMLTQVIQDDENAFFQFNHFFIDHLLKKKSNFHSLIIYVESFFTSQIKTTREFLSGIRYQYKIV